MKAMRIAVVGSVLIGLVAVTVHAGLFDANISGKATEEPNTVIVSASFSSKQILGTNKTEKLVLDSETGALEVVDQCGGFITNIVTIVGNPVSIGPDSNSNAVNFVLLSFGGSGDTNGAGVVTISNGKTFKATESFQIAIDGAIFVGKVTTSSAFKPASTCP
ncbi:MAG TPA: hypothetical protein VNL17_06415 [Verrucomicrobiae bacterium]|nr:hypothetical protein [Verrucomicrobiae bacterium]